MSVSGSSTMARVPSFQGILQREVVARSSLFSRCARQASTRPNTLKCASSARYPRVAPRQGVLAFGSVLCPVGTLRSPRILSGLVAMPRCSADPQIWITEFGWESTPLANTNEEANFGTVSRELQASYTVQAYETFRASGRVAGAFSFVYRIAPDNRHNWTFNWVDPEAKDKPVVDAMRQYLLDRSR